MRVTSVELHPEGTDNTFVLSFRDPTRQNPYNIKAMTGLDADEIIVRDYGANFRDLSLMARDLVMLIELNPDFSDNKTPSDLRDELYRAISSSRSGLIQVQFKHGADIVAVTSGFVTKLEAQLFQKTPEVKVTINTLEAMLIAPEPIVLSGSELDDHLIYDAPVLNLTVEDVLSTAPHGFNFVMEVLNIPVGSMIIHPPDSDVWSFRFDEPLATTPYAIGDLIYFSSRVNGKELYFTHSGVTHQLADKIYPGSIWPILFPGVNEFAFETNNYVNLIEVSYYPTYWGV